MKRNKLWHAELVDGFGNESTVCLLARTEEDARAKLMKFGECDEVVSISPCLMVALAELRGERGETFYYRTNRVAETIT